MNELKTISKIKDTVTKPKLSKEQKILNLMIEKNPNLKLLIEKLDLVLINNS
ncbi:MAG: hypothetical protein PHE33_07565 [Bacteroidales bacterium]|nr:hypothetical protein [Bacteroidales bacterium]